MSENRNDEHALSEDQKKSNVNFKEKPKTQKARPKYKITPLYVYGFKDAIKSIVSEQHFPDALATTFTLISVATALPFYPDSALVILLIATFLLSILHPLFGLAFLLFETLPIYMYQVPMIAWLFIIFMGASLFLGYKHYRTITFVYMLIALHFSYFGSILVVPAFVLTILSVGFKRAAITAFVVISVVVMSSGITGVQNSGIVVYNVSSAFSAAQNKSYAQFLVPSKPQLSLGSFLSGFPMGVSQFLGYGVSNQIIPALFFAFTPLYYHTPLVILQIIIWIFVAFAMSNHAVMSRSKYKGAEASLFSIFIPVSYILISYLIKAPFSLIPLYGFVAIPLVLLFLEFNDVTVVRALEVMKQDFRGRFGEVFEDLTPGTRETLEDVADYEETKKELKEAVLAPIEHRELAGAYNIKPAKGILLFGPPGTGKTFVMRALANEIRAGFFYVKTSQLLSPYPGVSAQSISRIFSTAKKHAPAILFFDEIDSIAGNREIAESDTEKQILSTLLSEMDGFQRIEGVVIVGATNIPQALDPSIMRPGRFDKIIYMPLPDPVGRKLIFKYYLKNLPVNEDLDYNKLVELTSRYSGADIKGLCEEVARTVAEEASRRNKVLQISTSDFVALIKSRKPSTTLAQVDEYNQFKMKYERRTHQELREEESEKIKLDDVVGLDDAKKALYEAVVVPILHPELVKKYDVGSINGVLLFGPPGTGKTTLIRAVANELSDIKVITLSGAEISKRGIEMAMKTIKDAFNDAKENAPAIIFVDEIDTVVPARDTASEFGAQLTGEFLQELDTVKDQYNIVMVATTNRPDALDPALLRAGRIDKIIYTGPPNQQSRAKIFELNLKKAPLSSGIDYNKLAEITQGYTGADIANICRQVKMEGLEKSLGGEKDYRITTDDLIAIIKNTKPSAPSFTIGRYLTFLSKYGER